MRHKVRLIYAGGGFALIIGRNSYQRELFAALRLLERVIRIYTGETPQRRRN